MFFFHMPRLKIGKHEAALPIVQGGMGVGISLSGLASAVADEGGVGVIAANAIGMIDPDYYSDGRAANIRTLRSEIRRARARSNGLIGVNIMVAANDFQPLLDVVVEERVDAVFMGAGLPIRNIPVARLRAAGVAVVPIVSSGRAAELIFRYWEKTYQDIPDAVVVEGPLAGGHLGFRPEQLDDPAYKLEALIPEVIAALAPFGQSFNRRIPVIAAGGVYSGEDILRFLRLGAQGVQMATRFVATHECDADIRFKEAYLQCRAEDIAIIKSPVGMPGRAIRNRFLESAAAGVRNVSRCAWRCLDHCDIKNSVYCISAALNNARQGELDKGFVFVGANAYRVKRIESVAGLIHGLKVEYETAVISSVTALKDEYLHGIESAFAKLQQEFDQARQHLCRLRDERTQQLETCILGLRQEYRRTLRRIQILRGEVDSALDKLNQLKERFPDRLAELQAIMARFPFHSMAATGA